jgi:hypothetical protein
LVDGIEGRSPRFSALHGTLDELVHLAVGLTSQCRAIDGALEADASARREILLLDLLFRATESECLVRDPDLLPQRGALVVVEETAALASLDVAPVFENCTAVKSRFDRVGADELTALRHVPFPDPEVEGVHARHVMAFLRLRSDCPEREYDAERPDHELILPQMRERSAAGGMDALQ